ncbi:helix-turn-helix domain-containing protein [Streptomyces virginiae]|uniref:helix-turn-helix domain-containing protein n=1 Tax=Streptomyces virginiae TaxID=1961 RepID=UPI0037956DE1
MPELLTAAQVAEHLHVKERTLQHWRYLKKGPAYIKGRPVKYRRDDLERWLDGRHIQTEAEAARSGR